MEQIDVLLDTNILIKIWRGDEILDREVSALSCGIDTVVCLEFLQDVNKNQRQKADTFISRFKLAPFSAAISLKAIDLIRTFAHSRGLRMPDALIAAASLEYNIPLLTLNIKDFDFIEGIDLI
jgi:predicted nucleic acid-binding protein